MCRFTSTFLEKEIILAHSFALKAASTEEVSSVWERDFPVVPSSSACEEGSFDSPISDNKHEQEEGARSGRYRLFRSASSRGIFRHRWSSI